MTLHCYVSVSCLYVSLCVIMHIYCSILRVAATREQICHDETFRARCPYSQKLLITSAKYGHIEASRCVSLLFEAMGQFGCMSDVKSIVAERCDRKSRCEVPIPDAQITSTVSCEKGFPLYLDVTYACIPEVADLNSCDSLSIDRNLKYITSNQILDLQCIDWETDKAYIDIKANNDLFVKATFTFIDQNEDNEAGMDLGIFADDSAQVTIIIPTEKETVQLESKRSSVKISLHKDLNHPLLIALQGTSNLNLGCVINFVI